ncbi:MAG: EutN/CcmL family microcompartment protein [Kiritimatiellae bacterium]|nr:EutN/CcmL family microcompartment protein [Kiritimatiellia bacterium]
MILGRVVGAITSTINHPFYDGKKLMLVEKVGEDGKPLPGYLVAVDMADSGAGETVLVLDEGNGARQVLESKAGPVRSVIVGVVDDVVKEKAP